MGFAKWPADFENSKGPTFFPPMLALTPHIWRTWTCNHASAKLICTRLHLLSLSLYRSDLNLLWQGHELWVCAQRGWGREVLYDHLIDAYSPMIQWWSWKW